MTEETAFKNKVNRYLKTIPELHHFPYFSGGFGRAGVSDQIICYKGRFIGLELKKEKGIASPLQLDSQEKIKQAGGIVLIIRPSTFNQLKLLLEEIAHDTTKQY